MPRHWKTLFAAPLLALSLALAGCETARDPLAPEPAATAPDPLLGTLLSGGKLGNYTLVREPLLSGLGELRVAKLIGAEGGELSLLGHTLRVPVGAVPVPTLFSLSLVSTGYVQVDLGAVLGLVDVGGQGFLRPVPVSLTYARASNVTSTSRLHVLRIKGPLGLWGALTNSFEVMPTTVDPQAKTVNTELEHFSTYAIGMD